MTDPNPLREDEVAEVAKAIQDLMPAWLAEDGRVDDDALARAAILRLDQVREGRGK